MLLNLLRLHLLLLDHLLFILLILLHLALQLLQIPFMPQQNTVRVSFLLAQLGKDSSGRVDSDLSLGVYSG